MLSGEQDPLAIMEARTVLRSNQCREEVTMWLEPGYYASRPPGEVHGPFIADGDVVILEMSYPSQAI